MTFVKKKIELKWDWEWDWHERDNNQIIDTYRNLLLFIYLFNMPITQKECMFFYLNTGYCICFSLMNIILLYFYTNQYFIKVLLQKVLFVIFLKKGDKTLHKKLSVNLVEHFWRVFTWEFMKFQKTLRQKTLCELKEYPNHIITLYYWILLWNMGGAKYMWILWIQIFATLFRIKKFCGEHKNKQTI